MKRYTQRGLFYAALFLLWAAVAASHYWPPTLFPSPDVVWLKLYGGFAGGHFLRDIYASLVRLLIGFSISAVIGIILGLWTARIRWVDDTVGHLVIGLQALPSICWVPAALLWFGPSEPAILFVVIMGSSLAITVAVRDAALDTPPLYQRAARSMGVKGRRLYTEVLLPAALPGIISGLKQGWLFAWRSLLGAELLVSAPGLGRLLQQGKQLNDIGLIAAVMVTIMIFGWLVDKWVFSAVEERIRHVRGMLVH
jgi:NitT/TauT family transport system permease protein